MIERGILQCGLGEQMYLGIGLVLVSLFGIYFTLLYQYISKKDTSHAN